MTSPHSPYGPPPGQQPGHPQQPGPPPQNPPQQHYPAPQQYPAQQQPYPPQQYPAQQYPQQQYPQQPYPQQYPAQQYGYPAQPYPASTATSSPLPAYIIGGLLSATALVAIVAAGMTPTVIPPVVTLAGGILYILRIQHAPAVSVLGGALALLLLAPAVVIGLIDDPSEAPVAWQGAVLVGGYSLLTIVLALLPPARRAVRPSPPPYRPY